MKRSLLPLLLLAALTGTGGACKHGSCGSGLPTAPDFGIGGSCQASPDCIAFGAPGSRCYNPEGNGTGLFVCELPGPPCRSDADCGHGRGCVISIELLSGRGAQAPLTTCQPRGIPCSSSSPFG